MRILIPEIRIATVADRNPAAGRFTVMFACFVARHRDALPGTPGSDTGEFFP
ncbi:hypothetical protein [Achromobacter xylosoxidans]|uniref:hypothetical protein n=1 Tax=Alcaligenes xylosoxydans xylosoxydans TaxID=85698 RepID=UPI001EEAC4A3|nr:hypothetical protein [Achromobacter xylosoxidans]